MPDSTLALTLSRTDDPEPVASFVRRVEDAGTLEGPGRRTIPQGSGSTEYTGWTSTKDGSGSAFSAASFNRMVLIVDPDDTLADTDPDGDLGVWVKLYTTAVAGGSSTAVATLFFVRRRAPFVIPATVGTTVSGGLAVTRVAYFNANTSTDMPIQLEVEVPAA